MVSFNFFLYWPAIKPNVPIEADLALQYFNISLVINATEVFPFVPVTADIFFGWSIKKFEANFDKNNFELLVNRKIIFFFFLNL